MVNLQVKGAVEETILRPILEQAEREYPYECCGMILGPKDAPNRLSRIRACQNAQDKYHQLDPENFPRTAATAYFIDPRELLLIQKELREKGEEIRIIYHSHIDCGAYFSAEDKRVATSEGEPAYPGVRYLVMSVLQGKVADMRLYDWDPVKKDFV